VASDQKNQIIVVEFLSNFNTSEKHTRGRENWSSLHNFEKKN